MSAKGEATRITHEICEERVRQQEAEGFTPAHDDMHVSTRDDGITPLAAAAACYVMGPDPEDTKHRAPVLGWVNWPWDISWWRPRDRRRDLIRAAALIVAEIERLDRIAAGKPTTCARCHDPITADFVFLGKDVPRLPMHYLCALRTLQERVDELETQRAATT